MAEEVKPVVTEEKHENAEAEPETQQNTEVVVEVQNEEKQKDNETKVEAVAEETKENQSEEVTVQVEAIPEETKQPETTNAAPIQRQEPMVADDSPKNPEMDILNNLSANIPGHKKPEAKRFNPINDIKKWYDDLVKENGKEPVHEGLKIMGLNIAAYVAGVFLIKPITEFFANMQ